MPFDTSIFTGTRGIFRIATLVLGIIDLGLTADKYFSMYGKEEFFLAIVIIAFMLSLVWTVVLVVGVLDSTDQAELIKNIDTVFHLVAGILLVIATIVFFISVFKVNPCEDLRLRASKKLMNELGVKVNVQVHEEEESCGAGRFIARIFAGLLGLVNGGVYATLGYFVFSGKL